MTKPWEETWTVDEETSAIYVGAADERMTFLESPGIDAEGRGKLAAAAPDLVRALLAIRADVEAALADDATDETARAQLETIDAALRKAGVR